MGERYILMEGVDKNWEPNGDWWCVDTFIPDDADWEILRRKIVSAHSIKEAAESTVEYQNRINTGVS